jgi:hypothetical protein
VSKILYPCGVRLLGVSVVMLTVDRAVERRLHSTGRMLLDPNDTPTSVAPHVMTPSWLLAAGEEHEAELLPNVVFRIGSLHVTGPARLIFAKSGQEVFSDDDLSEWCYVHRVFGNNGRMLKVKIRCCPDFFMLRGDVDSAGGSDV